MFPKNWHVKAMAMYKEGYSDPEIAAAVGVTACAVWAWRKKSGLPTSFSRRRNRVKTAPVTAEEKAKVVRFIRDLCYYYKMKPAKISTREYVDRFMKYYDGRELTQND